MQNHSSKREYSFPAIPRILNMNVSKKKTVASTERDFYKHWTEVKLRYSDTDRQGHVNNVIFCTMYESGRCEFLFDSSESIAGEQFAFVIVKLNLDFLAEMNYPGTVQIGSRITARGNSSFTVSQALFQNDRCCSTAESVIVLTDKESKRSCPLTETVLDRLNSIS